jgi:hypothetical protein
MQYFKQRLMITRNGKPPALARNPPNRRTSTMSRSHEWNELTLPNGAALGDATAADLVTTVIFYQKVLQQRFPAEYQKAVDAGRIVPLADAEQTEAPADVAETEQPPKQGSLFKDV